MSGLKPFVDVEVAVAWGNANLNKPSQGGPIGKLLSRSSAGLFQVRRGWSLFYMHRFFVMHIAAVSDSMLIV